VSSISKVFIKGTVTRSSFRLSSKIWMSLPRNLFLCPGSFIEERYWNREFELALSVLSVRPPEEVIRPLKTEIE